MSRHSPTFGIPGASAQQRAKQLRADELRFQHRRALRWLLPVLALWVVAAQIVGTILPAALGWLVALAVPFFGAKRLYEPGPDVQRWLCGAAGERRTAQLLTRLNRRGWVILHDRAIPDSRANLDHLALLPDGRGAVLIDTKTTRGGGQVTIDGDTLIIGRSKYPKAIKTVLHEAESAARQLRVPVHPVIAVHGASVRGGRLRHHPSGLLVVAAPQVRHALTAIPHQADRSAVEDLTARATRLLPRYTD
ncbi:nuclease-related domain-containing protein [Streptomyces sp. NPDC051644]|uniref:nuclease-related domain-containing protein n=1 Tax=Streptomyces sp. NPDC051644 TaxID=3365666 RepID=UPI0037AB4B3C